MKKKLLFATLSLGLFACAPSKLLVKKTNMKENNIEASKTGLVMRPLLADLEVTTERKSITYKAPINLSMVDLKSNAMQLFLETNKCDYVVDPIFTTTTTIENKKLSLIEIKLTGLPATYKKIYQVDSLPKSVTQYANLSKNQTRLEYFNSVDEIQNKIGLELVTGNYNGIQLDFPLAADPSFRIYAAGEKNQGPTSVKGDVLTNTDTTNAVTFDSGEMSQLNLSLGAFKEFPVSPRLMFRILGGLNYSSYSFENDANASAFYTISGISNIGLRVGTGLDFKLSKSVHLVGKFHTNLGIFKFAHTNESLVDPAGLASVKIKEINFSGNQSSFVGVGIRFLF
jgi:hypothetical protein